MGLVSRELTQAKEKHASELSQMKDVIQKTSSNTATQYEKMVGKFETNFVAERVFPVGIYLIKVNNRNIRKRCEICSKLIIKAPGRRHWRRFGVFIVNFEHISHFVLVFLLLTLNM